MLSLTRLLRYPRVEGCSTGVQNGGYNVSEPTFICKGRNKRSFGNHNLKWCGVLMTRWCVLGLILLKIRAVV